MEPLNTPSQGTQESQVTQEHFHEAEPARDDTPVAAFSLAAVLLLAAAGAFFVGVRDLQRTSDTMYAMERNGPMVANEEAWKAEAAERLAAASRTKVDPVHGDAMFHVTCQACHGPNGAGVALPGIPPLGANLRVSTFIASHTDDQLVAFIKVGRKPDDPNSLMYGLMPEKGLNPNLTDADIRDIVAYLRTLQKEAKAAGEKPQTYPLKYPKPPGVK